MNPSINFPDDFPVLETERLSLLPFKADDSEAFFQLRSDQEFMQYLGLHPMKKPSEARDRVHNIMHAFNIGEGITWKISMKGSTKLIGYIGFWNIDFRHFRGEIGFGIDLDHQQLGLMSEAMPAILNYGFTELGLHSVKADVDPNNEGSISLLEGAGFKKEAHFRENYYFDGGFLDSAFYCMLKGDLK